MGALPMTQPMPDRSDGPWTERPEPHAAERGLVAGTAIVLVAEALALPSGLTVAALLTRHLLPADYGVYALGAAGVAWLEWTVVSLFSRAAFKLVAEADDWRPVGSLLLRAHLVAGVAAGALLALGSVPAARLLHAPALGTVLRVFAIDAPLFALVYAHRGVMVGLGRHGARAVTSTVRWTARAALVAIAVAMGATVAGVAAALVVASALELIAARVQVRPPLRTPRGAAPGSRVLLGWAAPLLVSSTAMRIFDRVDLFALRFFGGVMSTVGAYGVAQSLALAPALFGQAFAPAAIAMLSVRHRRGDAGALLDAARATLRTGALVLPFTLLAAGASDGLVELLFSTRYLPAAPLFALLVVGAEGALLISLCGGILVARGTPRWTIVITLPVLLTALLGHLLLIPRFGAMGAAGVTAASSLLGAAGALLFVRRQCGVPAPVPTLLRGLVTGVVVGTVAWHWPAHGLALVMQLSLLTIVLVALMLVLGEASADELRAAGRTMQQVRRGRTGARRE